MATTIPSSVEQTGTMTPNTKSIFFTLPPELRLEVYRHYLRDAHIWIKRPSVNLSNNPTRKSCVALSLIRTCRQIWLEAEPLIYDHAVFHVCQPVCSAYKTVPPPYHLHVGAPCCFNAYRGIRRVHTTMEGLDLLGFDYEEPYRDLVLRKPFDRMKHLIAEVDCYTFFDYFMGHCFTINPPQISQVSLLKKLQADPSRTFDLSIAVVARSATNLNDSVMLRYLTYNELEPTPPFHLHMPDLDQPSTWTAAGSPEAYECHDCRFHQFLAWWGLPQDEANALLVDKRTPKCVDKHCRSDQSVPGFCVKGGSNAGLSVT